MDKALFENYIKTWNNELILQNRKVVYFLDNVCSHNIAQPSNIQLVYFPPNTTSLIQPLDQGIIHSFKTNYRKLLMVKVLNDYYENSQLLMKSINLHCAIKFVSLAWNNVKNEGIKNCFKNLSAPCPNFISKENKSYENSNHIEKLINKMKTSKIIDDELSINEYIDFDSKNNIITGEIPYEFYNQLFVKKMKQKVNIMIKYL